MACYTIITEAFGKRFAVSSLFIYKYTVPVPLLGDFRDLYGRPIALYYHIHNKNFRQSDCHIYHTYKSGNRTFSGYCLKYADKLSESNNRIYHINKYLFGR